MAIALMVTQPFGKYQRGDRITDAKEIASVRATRSRHFTVRVIVPDSGVMASEQEKRVSD